MLLRLADAIVNDIEIVANESRETLKRQLGFYHYADKRAYNAMIRNRNVLNLDEEQDIIPGEPEASAAIEMDLREDEREEQGSTEKDPIPDPKLEEKENRGPTKNRLPAKTDNLKLIFISNTPRTPKSAMTPSFPKSSPLKEKNVWNI